MIGVLVEKGRKMTCGVYKITSPSGNFYIGSSVNIRKRWNEHIRSMKNGSHHSNQLQRAADKYGIDSFKFEILEECDVEKETIISLEQKYIDKLKPKYNSSPTAGSCLGYKWSDDRKTAFSIIKKKLSIKHTDESRRKLREARARQISSEIYTESVRSKMSNSAKKRMNSEEGRGHIEKLRKINSGKKWTEEEKLEYSIKRRGEGSGRNKLKEIDVIKIKTILSERKGEYGLIPALAAEFGVTVHNINAIKSGRTWSHVTT
jgi:group I intron endonuclease